MAFRNEEQRSGIISGAEIYNRVSNEQFEKLITDIKGMNEKELHACGSNAFLQFFGRIAAAVNQQLNEEAIQIVMALPMAGIPLCNYGLSGISPKRRDIQIHLMDELPAIRDNLQDSEIFTNPLTDTVYQMLINMALRPCSDPVLDNYPNLVFAFLLCLACAETINEKAIELIRRLRSDYLENCEKRKKDYNILYSGSIMSFLEGWEDDKEFDSTLYKRFIGELEKLTSNPFGIRVRMLQQYGKPIGAEITEEAEGTMYEGRKERIELVRKGDRVTFRRDANNPHRFDAIQVLNTRGESLGLVSQFTACAFVTGMDQGKIILQDGCVDSVQPVSAQGKGARKPHLFIRYYVVWAPDGKKADLSDLPERGKGTPPKGDASPRSASGAPNQKAGNAGRESSKAQAENLRIADEIIQEAERALSDIQKQESQLEASARRAEKAAEEAGAALEAEQQANSSKWSHKKDTVKSEFDKAKSNADAQRKKLNAARAELESAGLFALARKKQLKELIPELEYACRKADDDLKEKESVWKSYGRDADKLRSLEDRLSAAECEADQLKDELQKTHMQSEKAEIRLQAARKRKEEIAAGTYSGPSLTIPGPDSPERLWVEEVEKTLRKAQKFLTVPQLRSENSRLRLISEKRIQDILVHKLLPSRKAQQDGDTYAAPGVRKPVNASELAPKVFQVLESFYSFGVEFTIHDVRCLDNAFADLTDGELEQIMKILYDQRKVIRTGFGSDARYQVLS